MQPDISWSGIDIFLKHFSMIGHKLGTIVRKNYQERIQGVDQGDWSPPKI